MKEILSFTNPEFYCTILLSILNGFVLLGVAYKFFQIVQLYGYKLSGFFKWQKQTKFKYLSQLVFFSVLGFGGLLVFNIVFASFNISKYFAYIGLIFYFSLGILLIARILGESKKTPLKDTKRMRRLQVIFFIFNVIFSFVIIVLSSGLSKYIRFSTVAFTPILLYVVFPIVFYLVHPIEVLIQYSYIGKAKRKLKKLEAKKPKIKIGITGSYGKTSLKMILAAILSESFKVSYSPASYNTPMGITKFILKNVKASDDIIIAEMGARKPKDIKKLCNIICPDIGIITSVGEQHLETFKTVDNVAKTKFEIVEFSKPNAKIFVGDDFNLKKLFLKIKKEKYCTSNERKNGYFAYAKNTKAGTTGTKFTICIGQDECELETRLLGVHNIENIVLASSVAYKLGVKLEQIQNAVKNLKPISHRLELINAPNGVFVLDDTYNASPQGSKRALEVLADFTGKTKWVVTPGLIEQGEKQKIANINLGKNISEVADFVIVVNKLNRKAILEGLKQGGFNENNIFVVDTLEKAKEIIAQKVKEDNVVLLENDLPDNFI